MKKHFNKEPAMTKKDKDFENCTKCWICDSDYIDSDVKGKNYCHIAGKYGDFAHRNSNINVKLNQKNSCCISQPKKL